MYTVMGITGQIGGVVGDVLLAANQQVRAVVRDADKGRAWADRGCEVAQATIEDAASLTTAFRGAEGVFVLVPSSFDPTPGFFEARTIGVTLRAALEAASPARVVYLSTIGAQATRSNLLTQHTIIEEALGTLPTPITFLRPAWFMENCSWDVAPARAQGVIPSFLQPLDKPVPMVATADIGQVAAELLQQNWTGKRVVELDGAKRVSPQEVGTIFAKILGHAVRVEAVPRNTWQALFESQGVLHPLPRIQMLDGFNEGWIDFEGGGEHRRGSVTLETVIAGLTGTGGPA